MAKGSASINDRDNIITQYSFVWVILIIIILYTVSYKYLFALRATVERMDFVTTLNRIQSQLTLKAGEWYVVGKNFTVAEVESKNPFGLIQLPPENYQGVLNSTDMHECQLSNWCYLEDTYRVIYHVDFTDELNNTYEQEHFLVYKLELSISGTEGAKGLPLGLQLVPEYGFSWQGVEF